MTLISATWTLKNNSGLGQKWQRKTEKIKYLKSQERERGGVRKFNLKRRQLTKNLVFYATVTLTDTGNSWKVLYFLHGSGANILILGIHCNLRVTTKPVTDRKKLRETPHKNHDNYTKKTIINCFLKGNVAVYHCPQNIHSNSREIIQ